MARGGGGSGRGLAGTTFQTGVRSGNGVITISYSVFGALAATLVSDSTRVDPVTALVDEATAIQTAVNANPPQTATACAGITDYLGLVQAQTNKTLTQAQAKQLTTAANNLASALGAEKPGSAGGPRVPTAQILPLGHHAASAKG